MSSKVISGVGLIDEERRELGEAVTILQTICRRGQLGGPRAVEAEQHVPEHPQGPGEGLQATSKHARVPAIGDVAETQQDAQRETPLYDDVAL